MAAGPVTRLVGDGNLLTFTAGFWSSTGAAGGTFGPMPMLLGGDGLTAHSVTNTVFTSLAQGGNAASVVSFHSTDNQILGGSAFGINTGGVAQLLNAGGGIDRQRETSFDNVPQAGIASGTQQLAGPPLATTITQAVTGNAVAQTVTVAATSFTNRGVVSTLQVGSTVNVGTGALLESVFLSAVVAGTSVTGVFKNNHSNADPLTGFSYNQARDATIPDGSTPAGINAGAAYLFNAATNTVEFERSFNGELSGATGTGAAIAAEYEDSSGGPVLASGKPSGLRLFPGQNLLGKGKSAATAITASVAGNTSIVITGGAAGGNTLPAGHPVQLSGSGTIETVITTQAWVPGSSATVAIQSPVVNSGQTSAVWDIFAANGPGLNGFLPHGIAIEEEALYNPVDGLFYLERSATQDAMPAANIVAENPALWNGATMDRQKGVLGAGYVNIRTSAGVEVDLSLGQKLTVASQSVIPASDSPNFPVAQASVAFDVQTSVPRPANTTAYTANNVVFGALDLGILGPSAKAVMITSAQLELDIAAIPTGMTSFVLYLFSVTPPSALGNAVAFALPVGDRASFLGLVNLGTPVAYTNTLYAEANILNKQVLLAGTHLFAYLVTVGPYTPVAASEVYKVTLHTVAV